MKTKLQSFAKINLGLRILNKRKDGYHDLETIFYPIKLHDDIYIEIEPAEKNLNTVVLKSNKSFIPLNKENLCYKAVEKFFIYFRIKENFKIDIELIKNIPVGGGLGGGSSDAASVLKFLIKFFNLKIEENKDKILELALSLGSDVPFFLVMKPCYASGRGEKIKILQNFKIDCQILVVNPNLHISTKWAFEKLNLPSDVNSKPVLNTIVKFDPDNTDIYVNDFEKIVFPKYEILKKIKNELYNSGCLYASLSGSGATMYALYDKRKKREMLSIYDHYKIQKYFTYISD